MRIFITGITGFVGSHLAEYALGKEGVEVYGAVRWRSRMDNVEHIEDRLHLLDCDLRDNVAVKKALEEVRPDYIFHLAAQSFVPTSWKAPAETLTTNILSELNLLESIRDLKLDTRIQVAGSSEEYGLVFEYEAPIKEDNPLRPLSPYAVSKVAQDYLAYQYNKSYGIFTVRTRAFNHTGPRRGQVFVTSDFSRQVALIEKGKKEPVIEVGNLEARRDFSDVRDIVRAYWLSLEKGEPGEVYNLGSGKAITIQELLDLILSMSDVQIEVRQMPERMRPSDVELLLCDYGKFNRATGWKPEIPFEKTVKDLLDYWRERV
ncbi:MAG: GDP-mannose 4,6-dehydratase [Actinomycetota bacterium]|nr:GDP-mannose 4,6-dehydratase [Actinomycetota bacterium]MDD5666685.1 GDP-mannose 4,6-dehydratase [Actinomycetota bacterium]